MNLQSATCPVPAIATGRPCVRSSLSRKIILFGRVGIVAATIVTLPHSFSGGKLVATAWAENADDDRDGIPGTIHTNDSVGAPHDLQSAENSDDRSNPGSSSEVNSPAKGPHDIGDSGSDESWDDSGNHSDDDTAEAEHAQNQ